MNWIVKDCSPSDMIRIKLGTVYHYGIFISQDEIIQFGLPPVEFGKISDEKIAVLSTNKRIFSLGKEIEVAVFDKIERKQKNDSKKIIQKARSELGNTGYNLIRNNCEHFAFRCVFDDRIMTPGDKIRMQWKNRKILHIYVSKIPDNIKYETLFPNERNEELNSINNPRLKKEKYWSWKTLEYGLLRSFGIKIFDLYIKKNSTGKWICDKYFFSISHSEDLVAVAVSSANVGVDIENVNNFEKMFSGKEKYLRKHIVGLPFIKFNLETLLKLWTKKEATWKCMEPQKKFVPKKINPNKKEILTKIDLHQGIKYCLSVASQFVNDVQYYTFSINENGN